MSILPAPPPSVAAHVPRSDHRQPVEETKNGNWIIAGLHSLTVANADGIVQSAMWYEIQYAKWDAQTKSLTISWVDPSQAPLCLETTSTNPRRLMEVMSMRVEHALVIQLNTYTNNGTSLTASVRRGADNLLFSMVVTDGPTDQEALNLAHNLENQVRESVGLPTILPHKSQG